MRDLHKREKILRAAIEVISRKGFYQSKISEIAKSADVADGTIYLYFHNKDDILINIFEEAMTQIINEMRSQIAKEKDPQKKIEQFAKTHMGLVKKNRALSEVIQVEIRQSSKFMKEYDNRRFAEYLDMISEIIIEGQEQGVFRPDINPGIAKRAFFGALDELSRLWVLAPHKKYSISTAAKQISDCFLKGLTTSKNTEENNTGPTNPLGMGRKGGKGEYIDLH
jgi:TetR/AcrR family transcriptional regulator, fatty acid metabolism regulator protein